MPRKWVRRGGGGPGASRSRPRRPRRSRRHRRPAGRSRTGAARRRQLGAGGGHGNGRLAFELAADGLDGGLETHPRLGLVELGPAGPLPDLLEAAFRLRPLRPHLLEVGRRLAGRF